MTEPEVGQAPRGNSLPRRACPTFTTRAIALLVHCLRRTPWVRELETAEEWSRYGEDAEAKVLRLVPGWARRALPMLLFPPFRALFLGIVDFRVPGTVRHILCRKLWFHEQAANFLATNESSQVVILGAGLDALGMRLSHRFENATLLELDRDPPMAIKREAFADVANLQCITVADESGYADSLSDLASLGCDPDRPTLVLAEGLLMYLDPRDVERVFEQLATSTRAPLRLAFSYLSVATLADPTSPIARLAVALERRRPPERFAWSTAPEALSGFLASKGYSLEETMNSSELATHILGKNANHRDYGEFVATATAAR